MKKLHPHAGYTLVELMTAGGLSVMIGVMGYLILHTGMILFAKNTSINVAHQQARVAVVQMESDLHAAVSLPLLCDTNRVPVSGSGPSAGISFQLFAGGPFTVKSRAASGQNQVVLALGGFQAKAGQRLIIPTHHIEIDLAADSPGAGVRSVTLTAPLPRSVEIQLQDEEAMVPVDVIAFITERVAYVVNGSELRYYGRKGSTAYSVLANNITEPSPFSTPQTPAGAPYYRFVAAINLSTADSSTSNRGFKSANMFLNAQVPCRTRLCAYQ